MTWWWLLCAAAAINVVAWACSAWHIGRQKAGAHPDRHRPRTWLLWLAAIYVLGCGFRSVFPMVDVPRICLHDTWISRIAVGRSIATVAELSLALQLALFLRMVGTAPGGRLAARVARAIVPLIVLAELCSWTAVLQDNNLLHAIENSLWTVVAILILAALVALRRHPEGRHKRFLALAMGCAAGYVAYMLVVDVPMYLARWQATLAHHDAYLSLQAGWHEVLQRCRVVRNWSAWQQDVPWLSMYFTVAVWISIGLAHVPLVHDGGGPANPGPGRDQELP